MGKNLRKDRTEYREREMVTMEVRRGLMNGPKVWSGVLEELFLDFVFISNL